MPVTSEIGEGIMTNRPDVPRTIPVLALKVLYPRKLLRTK